MKITVTFRSIENYTDYMVTNFGEVFSKKSKKYLKKSVHNGKQPYFYVTLSKNGKTKKFLVHRLVAEAFIPNPKGLPQVNHIDGNPQNNRVTNLEWVTNAENTQHAYDNHLNVKNQLNINFNGEVHSLRKWCTILNLDYKKVWYRYNSGMPLERCFEGGDLRVKY